jgi:hypothetical protein
MKKRVLIASEFNARDRAHFAQAYEFCRVITECDDADLVAPGLDNYIVRRLGRVLPQHDTHNVQRDFNRLVTGVRKGLGLRNAPTIERVPVTQDYELFVFIAWSPQSLVELARLKNWRKRCKVAVAYLFELWSSTLDADRAYLRLLDQFDHVFLLHSASIERLPSFTRAPVSALPIGVDCLLAAPYPSPPARVVDFYSFGNRSASMHRQMLKLVDQRGMFYIYDSLASTDSLVKDWGEHRALLANTIKRTRYFIGFSPASLAGPKADKAAGEEVLPGRLFEGTAGGAVILGTAPKCPEFLEYFDWPDVVVELDPERGDVASLVDELEAQPERLERIRQTNAVQCLLRHDWAYRWERILVSLGMQPRSQLHQRRAELARIAKIVAQSRATPLDGLITSKSQAQRVRAPV